MLHFITKLCNPLPMVCVLSPNLSALQRFFQQFHRTQWPFLVSQRGASDSSWIGINLGWQVVMSQIGLSLLVQEREDQQWRYVTDSNMSLLKLIMSPAVSIGSLTPYCWSGLAGARGTWKYPCELLSLIWVFVARNESRLIEVTAHGNCKTTCQTKANHQVC